MGRYYSWGMVQTLSLPRHTMSTATASVKTQVYPHPERHHQASLSMTTATGREHSLTLTHSNTVSRVRHWEPFYVRDAITSWEFSVRIHAEYEPHRDCSTKLYLLTSSTSRDQGIKLDNRGNDITESFGNSSRKEVRNESTKAPNVEVSWVSWIPFRIDVVAFLSQVRKNFRGERTYL